MKSYIAIGVVAAVAASGGAWVNGSRWESKYQTLQLSQANQTIAAADKTLQLFSEFGQNFTDALQNAEYARGLNEKAQKDLANTLRGLRSDIGGLQGDVASVSRLVKSATPTALAEYTTACAAVFADVVAAGERLSISGAEIAGKAEGHAVDAKRAIDAWPKVPPAQRAQRE